MAGIVLFTVFLLSCSLPVRAQDVRSQAGYAQRDYLDNRHCSYTFVVPPGSRAEGCSTSGQTSTEAVTQEEMDGLKNHLDRLPSTMDTLLSRIDNLSGRVDSLSGRIDNLSGQLSDEKAKNTELTGNLTRALLQLDSLITTVYANSNAMKQVPPTTCTAYKSAGQDHGDGWYIVRPDPNSEPFPVYCDQSTLGGGWMRFYYKAGPNTCYNYQGVTWTGEIMSKVNATDFLVSDDITTANTDQSWLFRGFTSGTTLGSSDKMQVFANLGNCRTPSGSQWSQGYTGAYLFVSGTLETLGSWTTMYVGCGYSSTATVGEATSIRFGGGPSHSGEFVHTGCNGYMVNYQNSITSRWNSDNVRVMWIR